MGKHVRIRGDHLPVKAWWKDWIDRLGVRVGTGVKWNPATLMAVGTQRGVFRLSALFSNIVNAMGERGPYPTARI